ncbi:DUF1318 domain-containing protein [Geomesophilobacter sediminis]|uniref:DUF1318 domain-containing protein n=1 Tax=Geomesophilobacter sediminis TaxID=2798584 RepID=A0A8J7LVB7_9BACT|nr:DUF1318 domain-containing protein [Geomesophilobacter sediminis]MBJ6724795.1 DUF1318 domain-containing protein [Geomesophilobacter sediminis]
MKRIMTQWAAVVGCLLLTACAVITVNVYFPEKAAKEAYKSLDEMLLKRGDGKSTPAGPPAPPPEQTPPPVGPQSSLIRNLQASLSFVGTAYAEENEADTLAVELSSMPEVIKAYDEMNSRLPQITALYNSGAVGLTNQGLVAVRDKSKVSPQDEETLAAENKSRKVVVTSMAKAILKLNKQKVTDAAMKQVMGKAAATFAEARREDAKPGWWVQLENGRWTQK